MTTTVSNSRLEIPRPTRAHVLAVMAVQLLGHGDEADLSTIFAADVINRPGDYAPAACQGTGPAAVLATSRWLRTAFDELAWKIRAIASQGTLVVVRTTMTGQHTGPLILHDHGVPTRIVPASGLRFDVTRTYRFHIADDHIIERATDFGELGTLGKDHRP
ncbi:ester cyclase [Nocardia thailandica]|uniref:Ester cyclase n=1 Tax=Nocardia thailandica TaxID=257275 RepID=A0ABW6PVP4_9NOCA